MNEILTALTRRRTRLCKLKWLRFVAWGVLAISSGSVRADVVSEWLSSLPPYTGPSRCGIVVSGQYLDLAKMGGDSFSFASGATLVRNGEYGMELVLGGGAIYGIEANFDLIIRLKPGTHTYLRPVIDDSKPSDDLYFFHRLTRGGYHQQYHVNSPPPHANFGINAFQHLLIYGAGTLDIELPFDSLDTSHGINVGGYNVGRKMMITGGSVVRINTPGQSTIFHDWTGEIRVCGATLETTGGNIFTRGDVVLDRAAVNILAKGTGVSAWGNLTISDSFCTVIAQSGNALYTRKALNMEGSIVYAMSEQDTCVCKTYESGGDSSSIGRGLYKFSSIGGSDKSAIEYSLPMTLNGGELVTCAPDGSGVHSVLYSLTMNSGLIRNQAVLNPKTDFTVSRELLNDQGLSASWKSLGFKTAFDPYSQIAQFLGTTLPGWMASQSVTPPEGNALAVVSVSSLKLNGGTVLSEFTKHGAIASGSSGFKVNGGSLQGPVNRSSGSGKPVSAKPTDANGNTLVCVTNTVAGAPYSNVRGGWRAYLPQTYDTSSLYLDGLNRLYFWVPASYAGLTISPVFEVKFNANGGTVSQAYKMVGDGGAVGTLPTPTWGGHDFLGWFTAPSGGTQVTAYTRVTANVTYYAHWRLKQYKLSYNGNGGTVSPAYKMVDYCKAYGTLPTPTWGGHDFKGWFTARSGGTQVTSSTKCIGNATIYAQWKVKQYKLTFNANGGTVSPAYKMVDYCKTCDTFPTPTWGGHTFNGWFTARSGGTKVTVPWKCIGNKTIYAQWKVKQYKLSYNANGGSVSPAYKMVGYCATYGTLPTPTWGGHDFKGWFTARSGGTQVTAATKCIGNLTVYAQWSSASTSSEGFTFGGSANWTKQSDGSWKSGAISNSQTSWIQTTVYGSGTVTFKWKVSSEANYDKLIFSVDGVDKESISGTSTAAWTSKTFSVSADGPHTLRWTYSKDISVSGGADCGWISGFTWTRLVELVPPDPLIVVPPDPLIVVP